ncbi:MAG: glycosyltransferase, partial [Thermodesulfovibrionia bacterium]|nr:glycosyltransferase [Thermodesulfovibrionia bacterium]
MSPKVSVVMSVYNGALYLKEALESILGQTYTEFEFVIVDDGSDDETWEILEGYASDDKRIVLIKNTKNMGLTRSLNRGLRRAQGLYVARQDHDDISIAVRPEKQVCFFDRHESTVLVSSNYDVIDGSGEPDRRVNLNGDFALIMWNLIFYNYLGGHSQVMFRRESAIDIGGFSESFLYAHAQDYDLWLKLSKFGQIYILPETLLKYRVHDFRLTRLAKSEQFKFVLKASANRVAELTGQRVELSEVKNLWTFWCLVYQSESFHAALSEIISIHLRIRKIFKAFIAEQRIKSLYGYNRSSMRMVRH